MNEEGVQVDKKMEWTRPCFKGYKTVVIGDSSVRAFARKKKGLKDVSITGYGGLDIMEMVCIIRAGKLSNDIDLGKMKVRSRYQAGRDLFALTRFCTHCFGECMENFRGNLVLVVGLNNVLHAEREPFANNRGQNQQRADQMFKRLDETVAIMVPNAIVHFALPLIVPQYSWSGSGVQRAVFASIVNEVKKRKMLTMDNDEPRRLGQFDRNGVHMWDDDSIEYWTKIIRQMESQMQFML